MGDLEGALVGPYRVVRLLGGGGFGAVWLARDVRLGRWVALKVLAASAPVGLEEARAAARLSHPNVVTVYDVGEHEGHVYLALEYVVGETLRQRLDGERMPSGEALRWAGELAAAIGAAHGGGVAHLDLTPRNVLLGRDGRLRVVDFGLARVGAGMEGMVERVEEARREEVNVAPRSGAGAEGMVERVEEARREEARVALRSDGVAGTPRYMAPEQWLGAPGLASDVWALGVVLHELFVGAHPLAELAPGLVRHRVCDGEPLALAALEASSIAAPIAAPIAALIAACLAKDAAARPTASEVVARLGAMMTMTAEAAPGLPFRGLVPFDEASAAAFGGREEELAELLALLGEAAAICVTGASGTGKSSLLRAGLAPMLAARGYTVVVVRPGRQPLRALAMLLEERGGRAAGETLETSAAPGELDVTARIERWRRAPGLCGMDLADAARASGTRLALLVDPLEELETLVAPEEREAALEALVRAAEDAAGPVRLVLAARDDFLGKLAARLPSGSSLGRLYVLAPPGPAALRALLERPVAAAGYAFEAGVVDEMVASVRGEAAALSLLQVTAAALWERRDEAARRLSRAAYDELGGVAGALAGHAERFLGAASPTELAAARQILLRLVAADGTRRPRPQAQVLEGIADGAAALERLIAARLVTTKRALAEGEELELAHELLAQRWRTLASWLDGRRAELASFDELVEAARRWDGHGRRADELWRDDVLAAGERQLARNPAAPAVARAFVAAARRQARRRRWWRGGAVAVAAGASIAFVATLAAQRQEARVQARRAAAAAAEAMAEAGWSAFAEGRVAEARALLRGAAELEVTPTARALHWRLSLEPVRTTLTMPTPVEELGWLDERTVVVRGEDSFLRTVSAVTGEVRVLGAHDDVISALVVAPGQREIFTGSLDYTVRRWSLDAPGAGTVIARHAGPVQAIAWSEERAMLATADAVGSVSVRSPDGLERWRAAVGTGVVAVAFAGERVACLTADGGAALWGADGARTPLLAAGAAALVSDGRGGVIVGTEGGAVIFFDGRGQRVDERLEHPGRVTALDAGGGKTVSGGGDGVARLRVAAGRSEEIRLGDAAVSAARFSPAGKQLALAFRERLQLRALETPALPDDAGFEGAVREVAFAAGDALVIGAGGDGFLRSFEVSSGAQRAQRATGHGRVRGLAVEEDGQGVLTTGDDGRVRRWRAGDLGGGEVVGRHDAPAVDLATGAGLIASAGFDHKVRVWGVGVERVLDAGAPVWSVAIAPVAGQLVATTDDRRLLAWPLRGAGATGPARVLMRADRLLDDVIVLADGRRAVVLGESPQLVIDLITGETTAAATAQRVYSGDAAPAGDRIAVAGGAGLGGLLELSTGAVQPLGEHHLDFWTARYSRDGRWVATAGEDGLVGVWRAADGRFAWGERATAPQLGALDAVTEGKRTVVTAVLAAGAMRVLGHSDGLVAVELGSRRIAALRLHGAVVSLTRIDDGIVARTVTGAEARIPIGELELPACALLRSIWRVAPAVWRQGRAVLAPPPARGCDGAAP